MSKEICSISGEVLQISDLLLGMDFRSIHPIFKAKKSLILTDQTVFNFQRASSWREKKLWYLATLNTFDLIDWKAPANPPPHVIEFSFAEAYDLACWIDYARHGIYDGARIQFPGYICDRDTCQLTNIPVWLDKINEIKKLFIAKDRENVAKKRLNDRAQSVEKEFRRANITGLAFTRELAKFALEASGCPEVLQNQYLEILTTPLDEAWMIGRTEKDGVHLTQEIYEFFEEELPIHNQSFLNVRLQAKKLMEAALKGYHSYGKETGEDKKQREEEFSYNILPDETSSASASLSPLGPEPVRHMFAKHWQFLAAHAAWELERIKREPKSGGSYKQF